MTGYGAGLRSPERFLFFRNLRTLLFLLKFSTRQFCYSYCLDLRPMLGPPRWHFCCFLASSRPSSDWLPDIGIISYQLTDPVRFQIFYFLEISKYWINFPINISCKIVVFIAAATFFFVCQQFQKFTYRKLVSLF